MAEHLTPLTTDWYKAWFADARYLDLYEHRDDKEADELIDLIEKALGTDHDRKVLDIACGGGRHLLAFARRGYTNLFGQDLSRTLIEHAINHAEGYPIRFTMRDMRDPIEGRYDLILNIFTSFGYFDTDTENEHVIRNCADALAQGGHFVLDYFNTPYLKAHLVAEDKRVLPGGEKVTQRRRIVENRVVKQIVFADGTEFIESVRLYESEQVEAMLTRAGLTIVARYGSYMGSSYDTELSPRLIIIAEKQ